MQGCMFRIFDLLEHVLWSSEWKVKVIGAVGTLTYLDAPFVWVIEADCRENGDWCEVITWSIVRCVWSRSLSRHAISARLIGFQYNRLDWATAGRYFWIRTFKPLPIPRMFKPLHLPPPAATACWIFQLWNCHQFHEIILIILKSFFNFR